eukprot:10909434-Heterocapsa_arctica.AAC.1
MQYTFTLPGRNCHSGFRLLLSPIQSRRTDTLHLQLRLYHGLSIASAIFSNRVCGVAAPTRHVHLAEDLLLEVVVHHIRFPAHSTSPPAYVAVLFCRPRLRGL